MVSALNLDCIPDYVTSSSEDEDEDYDSSRPWDEGDSKIHVPEHRRGEHSDSKTDSFLGKRS